MKILKLILNYLTSLLFYKKTEEEIDRIFLEKYKKLSQKYSRDFTSIILFFKENKLVNEENQMNKIKEDINKFLNLKKYGISSNIILIKRQKNAGSGLIK